MFKRDWLIAEFDNGEIKKYRVKVGCTNEMAKKEIERKTGRKLKSCKMEFQIQ